MSAKNVFKVAVLGLLSLGAAGSATGAQYNDPYDPNGYPLYTYFYYTDETHSEAAGSMIEHCDRPATVTGVETPYYNRYRTGYNSYTEGCTEY